MSNVENVKSKIAKLMKLAESSNVSEAEAALAKARELMIQYALTNFEIEQAMADHEKPKSRVTEVKVPNIQTPRQMWETSLADGIARAFNCRLLFNKFVLYFYGTPEDIEIASFTFEQLRLRLRDMAYYATGRHTEEYKAYWGIESMRGVSGPNHPKVWRMSYLAGAVDALSMKLAAMRRADSKEVTAMVHVRDGQITEYINGKFKKVNSVSIEVNSSNGNGYIQGYKDGSSMNVHPGIGAKQPKSITGG